MSKTSRLDTLSLERFPGPQSVVVKNLQITEHTDEDTGSVGEPVPLRLRHILAFISKELFPLALVVIFCRAFRSVCWCMGRIGLGKMG